MQMFWETAKLFSKVVIIFYISTIDGKVSISPYLYHLQDLLDLTPEKRSHFHHRGLDDKSRKSRDTWSNPVWPWSTKWSRAKANRVLPRERTGYSKHPLPTTQEKTLHMDITRWSIPKSDWLYSLQPKMEKLYTVSCIDQELTVAQTMNSYCQIQT